MSRQNGYHEPRVSMGTAKLKCAANINDTWWLSYLWTSLTMSPSILLTVLEGTLGFCRTCLVRQTFWNGLQTTSECSPRVWLSVNWSTAFPCWQISQSQRS